MRPSLKTLAINAAVVSALVGGTTAFTTFDKTVALSVDGEVETVHTFGDTVEEVLADQDIELGEHDVVAPSGSSPVEDGTEIAVRFGRLITVTIDGVEREVWTTALSVDEALDELGIRAAGAELSVSRSLGIGRRGLDFEIRTPKDLTIVADGRTEEFTTTALTVREALADAGITLGDRDQVAPSLEERITSGLTLTVKRVTAERRTVTVTIDHEVERRNDDSLYEGDSEVAQQGKDGKVERVVEVLVVDGVEGEQRVLSEQVIVAAVTEIVNVGTKERPAAPAEPIDTSVSGGVWDQLAECESGGNWSINTGNGYYGGLQFSLSTWQAYGGSGYPHENSKAEQIRIATKLRDATGGYGSWPACAAKLGLPT
ncbi:MAG TPA: ubiquitin-like domain-containing protein [Jiangellaceae bacterium]|nr:ubiquitin-like domain-containing protein [Jiangellaceae bacterium]